MRTTERLIQFLETVNATAVNNDDGKPGEFLAELCRESSEPLWKRWPARIRLSISAPPPGQSHRQHAFARSHQQTGRRDPGGVMPLGR
jgi:hypothetical protein